ncbi:MAG: RNA polymerase sigma factor for flagellar operon FliA [bacterium]|jgi:RNA polymerase sigma factor for flagellar operon FliA
MSAAKNKNLKNPYKSNPYLPQLKKTKEQVAIEYASNVKYIAKRLAARLPSNFDVDDLIQVGMIGLMEAADKFDPSKEKKFRTFAEYRIRGSMLDHLRAKDWIPRSVRDNGNKLEKAYQRLRTEGIDYPTDDQLANELEIPLKELDKFLSKSKPIPLLSIEDLGHVHNEDESLNILDTISNPEEEDPASKILGDEVKEQVADAILKLPEKEQLVLSLYYQEDLNLKEIAAVLELTESRVSQIRTKAIGMLRSYMKDFM